MNQKTLALTLASLLLAGCAVSPAYVAPDTPAITLASPQQAQFKGTDSTISATPWWTFFDDAVLAQLERIEQTLAVLVARSSDQPAPRGEM